MKRVGITEKPKAKGKVKAAAVKHDADLQDAQSAHTADNVRARVEFDGDCRVQGGVLQGVMQETIARVYSEMFPSMITHAGRYGDVDPEIKEEAYILNLTIAMGNHVDTPRRGLKVRDAEISGTARFCQEHV